MHPSLRSPAPAHPRLTPALLVTVVASALSCVGHVDGDGAHSADDGHGHSHDPVVYPLPGSSELELRQQGLTTYPAIDFNPRPSYHANNWIGLSFDDGPDSTNTLRVLDTLLQKGVKATFFINTNNFDGDVNTNPTLKNLIKRIVNEGHQLGSHTVAHLHLPQQSTAKIESEITGVQTTVNRSDVMGAAYPKITLLRAPFGEPYTTEGPGGSGYEKVAPIVARYAVHIGWAIDTVDYNCSGTPTQKRDCVFNAFKNAVKTPGTGDYGQVLMHSVQPQTADALPLIIDYARNNGFVFKLAEEMVQARFGQSSHQLVYGTGGGGAGGAGGGGAGGAGGSGAGGAGGAGGAAGADGGGGCTQTPLGGSARAIPGTIQAEDYDLGGQGCAYNDTTTANQGNAYRTSEGVDVQATTDTGGGFNLGYVQAGEWTEYTANVASTGNYRLELRVAATATGKTIDVLVDGAVVADNVAVPNTGNYQSFQTVTVPSVSLTAGARVVRVLFNQASQNLNWIKFTALVSCVPETDAAFCARLGKNCGTVTGPDNCGVARSAPCGSCPAPDVCSASNVCQAPCVPETDAAFCARLGKNCGTPSGTDNCGNPRTAGTCGSCTAPQVCGATHVCQDPSSSQYLYFEAESGTGAATAPMAVGNDTLASGGKYTWSQTSNSTATAPSNGRVRFTFTVTTAGTFKVWGRFRVGPSTTSDDSLWSRIDTSPFIQWNDIHPRVLSTTAYRWDAERDTPSGNALVTRTLSAGTHTLEIAYRENGLKIDRLLVTNDLAFVPSP